MLAFTRAARAARYTVSITNVFEPVEESVRAAAESLLGQHVEVIIVVADDRRVLEEANRLEPEVPLVAVDSTRRVGTSTVSIDQYAGARVATEYLVSPVTPMVYLAGPASSADGGERERLARRPAEHGLASSPPLFGDWTPNSGYRLVAGAVGRGLRRCSPPTTRWPWERCTLWPTPASTSRPPSASSGSTTSRRRRTSVRR